MTEHQIANLLVKQLGSIGYAGSLVLQEVEFEGGFQDLVLIPRSANKHGHRLVIVEVEGERSPAKAVEALGQLLKYYAYDLKMSGAAFDLLKKRIRARRRYFAAQIRKARKSVWGCDSQDEAKDIIRTGLAAFKPQDIGLYLAFADLTEKARVRLDVAREALREHHDLHVGLLLVGNRQVDRF